MTAYDGGEDERLAPVIPLFGAGGARQSAPEAEQADEGEAGPSPRHPAFAQAKPALRAVRTSFEQSAPAELSAPAPSGHTSADEPPSEPEPDPSVVRERAAEALVRKLRARAMSVSEARQVLRGHDLPAVDIDEVIEEFLHRGYLDDRTLAGALVTAGVERKGQGRVALSRALAQRGIPRDIVDEALAELPDDDAERALEFARTKARSMSRLEPETALRRLLGQLARRGYGGSVASNAARTALREAAGGGSGGGVRFVESD